MKGFKNQSAELRRQIFEQNTANHPTSIALIVEMHPHSKLGLTSEFKYPMDESG
jgi:hypothetical protein